MAVAQLTGFFISGLAIDWIRWNSAPDLGKQEFDALAFGVVGRESCPASFAVVDHTGRVSESRLGIISQSQFRLWLW